jgi:putative nucleotidyltransferase with HDIG domain
MRYRGIISAIASFIIPFMLFIFLRSNPSLDVLLIMPKGHFYIVSITAFLATIIAIMVGIAGYRLRNTKVIYLSLSYISLAEIFTLHGLSTPGFLLEPTHLPGFAAQISILLAVFWVWLSNLSSDNRVVLFLSRGQKYLVPVWTLMIGIFAAVTFQFPHLLHGIPYDRNPFKWVITVFIAVVTLFNVYRNLHSYQFSRFPLQIAMVYSSGLLMVAQIGMAFSEVWRTSWWLYHVYILASMIALLIGLVRQYTNSKSISLAIKTLFTTDPMERIASHLSPSLKALIAATESKDAYTAGHNYRVTVYALKIAEELSLMPEQLRALAQGGIIHDVGKISIPDHILNKPGKLTEEERKIIEQHTIKGYDMCKRLGFMKEELDIIRHHHEKWDGTGYPDRLAGEHIPLLARIVAVADVYDALTSTRSYRKACSHDEAIRMINELKGIHFDPQCVDAWNRVCEKDQQIHKLKEMNAPTLIHATFEA